MFYHDPHLGDGETKGVKPLPRLFQHAGSCQWIQNPNLSVSGLSLFISKTTSQGCCEVKSRRKCSRNGSSCCHSFFALWNEVLRSLLDSPLCQHSPALLGVGDFLEPRKVPEAVWSQIHLLSWAQDVCSLLPEKKSCLGCKPNTEHDQNAKGVSKWDNANRDNSCTDQ